MPSPGTVLAGSYDHYLVALSVVIAMCASYTALDFAGRVTTAKGRSRLVWLTGGASTMGLGIWAMHYIGMLAYTLPVPTLYDWPTVLLSLIAAILASAVSLFVVSQRQMDVWRAVAGSVLMGAGIAAMHYIGMDAMRLAAKCHFSVSIVSLSVLLAIIISFVGLWLVHRAREETKVIIWQKVASAVVIGAAIPVMHYTGMAAASFTAAEETGDLSHTVSISVLGSVGIAIVTMLVLSLAVLTSAFSRRYHAQALELETAAAEAEAANRAKSTFLSTMSHEIRTPLNAILGYAQLMSRDPTLGMEAKTNLKIIGRSGEHMLALINDVLDMSKIEADRVELNSVTFNLPRLLDHLAVMFRLRAEAKALRFETLVDGESVVYVVADEAKISQVLINLLGNAIKFTKRGQIKLHATLGQRSANGLWLSVRVEDTGSGITDEEQKKLFEPFSQTKGGLNAREGTGLGLAISRRYARLMGGDVTVTSNPGSGSIFQLEIPIERGNARGAIRRSVPRRVIRIRAGTLLPRILVVDDQIESRDWLMKLLTSIGFSVRGAENGEAAIRNWREWNPRLILMDVHMPVMDGLEATRIIKADPRGKETVIVTLTASAMDDDLRTISQSAADDFLAKPCREDELLEKMGALLNIAYEYEEMSEDESQPLAGVAALSAEGLRQLPLELVEELRNATSSGNKKLLDKLILKVRETEDAGSAQALKELADKYEYDALTRLLEEACRR